MNDAKVVSVVVAVVSSLCSNGVPLFRHVYRFRYEPPEKDQM